MMFNLKSIFMEKFFYAGSFSPFTRGHLDIVMQALEKYDCGVIAIGRNPAKRGCFITLELCQKVVEQSLKYVDSVRGTNLAGKVEVISYDRLTVDAAHQHGATVIIRGSRCSQETVDINARLIAARGYNLRQETFYTPESLSAVSSSAVRSLLDYGEYQVAQQFILPPAHNMLMISCLKDAFMANCGTETGRRHLSSRWADFAAKVSARAYHNFSHIACMLSALRWSKIPVEDKKSLICAIFYHDYDPDIETSFQASGLPEEKRGLFYATDHLRPTDALSGDERLIHDLDLLVLADKAGYEDYRNNIRLENLNLPLDRYRENRVKMLKALHESVSFQLFPSKFTEQAQENIAAEIKFWEAVADNGLPPQLAGLQG